jgi:hypothetical protein
VGVKYKEVWKGGEYIMARYKRDEVIALDAENGIFHVDCYDGNLNEIEERHVVSENDIDDEDWKFCDKCGKQI